jgi:hypothetical protein
MIAIAPPETAYSKHPERHTYAMLARASRLEPRAKSFICQRE